MSEMGLLEALFGIRRFGIDEMERAVLLRNGRVSGILGPGVHTFFDFSRRVQVERHDLTRFQVSSRYEDAILAQLPTESARHFQVFETGPHEVAVVERQGRILAVLRPDKRMTVWKDAGPFTATTIDVSGSIALADGLRRRMIEAGIAKDIVVQTVQESHCAIIYVDGAQKELLGPGVHSWWNVGRAITARVIDLRNTTLDVTGQEVLTRDRVTIRINLSAEYRVADPLKAAAATASYSDALYRALQYAFRKTLGAMTLDQILEKKASVDEEVVAKARADMAAIGLEVFDITLKDIVLPGEMREILNQVVAAEKQAEANVIRRREETNATRSLLNTARVMAENPVMLRLKELEALEAIAGKVERLTINNGTSGLLNDIAKLRE